MFYMDFIVSKRNFWNLLCLFLFVINFVQVNKAMENKEDLGKDFKPDLRLIREYLNDEKIAQKNSAFNCRNKDIVMVIGPTGVGKSLFSLYISKHNIVSRENTLSKEKEINEENDFIEEFCADSYVFDQEEEKDSIVGHGKESKTFFPNMVYDKENKSLLYFDCPGFFDTSKKDKDISISILISSLLSIIHQYESKIKLIIFLVPEKEISKPTKRSNMAMIDTYIELICYILGDPSKYAFQILLGISIRDVRMSLNIKVAQQSCCCTEEQIEMLIKNQRKSNFMNMINMIRQYRNSSIKNLVKNAFFCLGIQKNQEDINMIESKVSQLDSLEKLVEMFLNEVNLLKKAGVFLNIFTENELIKKTLENIKVRSRAVILMNILFKDLCNLSNSVKDILSMDLDECVYGKVFIFSLAEDEKKLKRDKIRSKIFDIVNDKNNKGIDIKSIRSFSSSYEIFSYTQKCADSFHFSYVKLMDSLIGIHRNLTNYVTEKKSILCINDKINSKKNRVKLNLDKLTAYYDEIEQNEFLDYGHPISVTLECHIAFKKGNFLGDDFDFSCNYYYYFIRKTVGFTGLKTQNKDITNGKFIINCYENLTENTTELKICFEVHKNNYINKNYGGSLVIYVPSKQFLESDIDLLVDENTRLENELNILNEEFLKQKEGYLDTNQYMCYLDNKISEESCSLRKQASELYNDQTFLEILQNYYLLCQDNEKCLDNFLNKLKDCEVIKNKFCDNYSKK